MSPVGPGYNSHFPKPSFRDRSARREASKRTAARVVTLTEDEWYSRFRPIQKAADDVWFGTDGEDLARVRAADPRKVWTLVEVDSYPSEVIVAGMHTVNRISYAITEVAWEDGVEYEIFDDIDEDDDYRDRD